MKIEISISGPAGALAALCRALESFEPTLEHLEHGAPRIVLFSEHEALDDRLMAVSRLTADLEKALCPEAGFDFRVRNLAYCEPPAFRDTSAYEPVPGLIIQPYDPSSQRKDDPRTIFLDAEQAFGNGRHATTLLCLDALARLAQGPWGLRHRRVLDFGCGTGLLALAALKLGAPRAVGVEIDHDAAQTARKNVALNAMSGRIEIKEGSWEDVTEKYDLIFANLVASLLLRTGSRIPHHLGEEGRAVISGFSAEQAGPMEEFFFGLGLVPMQRETRDGWCCLVLAR